MSTFHALLVEKTADGFNRGVVERSISDLPEGEVLIDVRYSSLNYKDALSATGNPGVTRNFPHTPGIDAAGLVTESSSELFAPGDEVIVIGFDLGMNTPGGFGQRIRVPAGWVVRKPEGLSLHESMLLGTAGFTAALAVDKLEHAGMTPESGPILVTGATGGVGSVAVMLLAELGYEVAAVTGKADQHEFLSSLGASRLLSREQARADADRPLLKETWGGVVDCVGGEMLSNGLKSLRYDCSLAACGLVESPQFPATVLPFILRNVNLLGVDSVQLPLPRKAELWNKLAGPWKLDRLAMLEERLTLSTVSEAIDRILAGRMVGRGVVDLSV
ncbi:MAG: YhdH/YhfP family quinone oxidoreductase [Pseudomonadales bacterium]